jgi:hypothetical protein
MVEEMTAFVIEKCFARSDLAPEQETPPAPDAGVGWLPKLSGCFSAREDKGVTAGRAFHLLSGDFGRLGATAQDRQGYQEQDRAG